MTDSWFQCDSSVVVLCYLFLVSVSVTQYLQITFSSIEVAEWPPFGKELLMFFLYFGYL